MSKRVVFSTNTFEVFSTLTPIIDISAPAVDMVNVGGNPAAHNTQTPISFNRDEVLLLSVFSQSLTARLLFSLPAGRLRMANTRQACPSSVVSSCKELPLPAIRQ